MSKLPFVYRVCSVDPNCRRETAHHGFHAGEGPKHKDKFVVYVGSFDYVYRDMGWANDSKIGEAPLVPDLDAVKEEHEFTDESAALAFVRDWWAQQGKS